MRESIENTPEARLWLAVLETFIIDTKKIAKRGGTGAWILGLVESPWITEICSLTGVCQRKLIDRMKKILGRADEPKRSDKEKV